MGSLIRRPRQKGDRERDCAKEVFVPLSMYSSRHPTNVDLPPYLIAALLSYTSTLRLGYATEPRSLLVTSDSSSSSDHAPVPPPPTIDCRAPSCPPTVIRPSPPSLSLPPRRTKKGYPIRRKKRGGREQAKKDGRPESAATYTYNCQLVSGASNFYQGSVRGVAQK